MRVLERAFGDAGTHNSQWHLAAVLDEQLFAHGLGKSVHVIPAVMARSAHPFLDQLALGPAAAAVVNQLLQAAVRQRPAVALLDDLAAECLLLLGTARLGADGLAGGLRLGDLFFGDERLRRGAAVD